MKHLQRYNKMYAAIAVAGLFAGLNHFGLSEESTLGEVVQVVLIAAGVYAVPNKH